MIFYTQKLLNSIEATQKNRGSLPDLRHDCTCPRRFGQQNYSRGYSSGSTESLLEEADEFLYRSREDQIFCDSDAKRTNRRCSENDIQRGNLSKNLQSIVREMKTYVFSILDFLHSKQSLPFLPRSPKCLKPGFLAKVISKNGRVVIGKIRYVGPLAASSDPDECFVGLQLTTNSGDSDGTVDGKKFFECEPNFGTFVQFKKVVMVWSS